MEAMYPLLIENYFLGPALPNDVLVEVDVVVVAVGCEGTRNSRGADAGSNVADAVVNDRAGATAIDYIGRNPTSEATDPDANCGAESMD